jgi:hypothetical protein
VRCFVGPRVTRRPSTLASSEPRIRNSSDEPGCLDVGQPYQAPPCRSSDGDAARTALAAIKAGFSRVVRHSLATCRPRRKGDGNEASAKRPSDGTPGRRRIAGAQFATRAGTTCVPTRKHALSPVRWRSPSSPSWRSSGSRPAWVSRRGESTVKRWKRRLRKHVRRSLAVPGGTLTLSARGLAGCRARVAIGPVP